MTGKAKPKKHTAKEVAAKVDAATTNRGGGKAGPADLTGQEKGGNAKLECPHCKATAPDSKTMQIHHEARHPKIPFEEDKLESPRLLCRRYLQASSWCEGKLYEVKPNFDNPTTDTDFPF